VKIVLDTNAYCLCDTGHEQALEMLDRATVLFLPTIVLGELYYGFKYGTRLEKNLDRLEKFIQEFEIEIIQVDKDVARKFGDIYAALRNKGRPIPTNDIWIAACCMSVGGILMTADDHFTALDQIQVEILRE